MASFRTLFCLVCLLLPSCEAAESDTGTQDQLNPDASGPVRALSENDSSDSPPQTDSSPDTRRPDPDVAVLDAIPESDALSDNDIVFKDPALKSCVLAHLPEGVRPSRTVLQTIKELICYGGGLTYLDGIEQLTFLEKVTLRDQTISGFESLGRLSRLKYLNVKYSEVKNLSGLQNCSSCETMLLSDNEISDIEPLGSCTNLKELDLGRNRNLSDISIVSSLVNLKILSLGGTSISTLEPAASLSKLELITFGATKVTDVSPLKSLLNLQQLLFPQSGITDISPLSGLSKVQVLIMDDNAVEDISAVSAMPNLRQFLASNNKIRDLSPIATLTKLERVQLGNNQIETIPSLTGFAKLQQLGLGNNQIDDVSWVSPDMQSLGPLDLASNFISNIEPLARLNLAKVRFNLPDNCIEDFSPIASMPDARVLGKNSQNVAKCAQRPGMNH